MFCPAPDSAKRPRRSLIGSTRTCCGEKERADHVFALVDKDGTVKWSSTCTVMPESKLLEEEVQRALTNAKMIPAIRIMSQWLFSIMRPLFSKSVDDKPRRAVTQIRRRVN